MNFAGEYEGAAAPFMWDQMPRNALRRKACGERSEDFCAAWRHKSNGIMEAVEKTFSTASVSHRAPPCGILIAVPKEVNHG